MIDETKQQSTQPTFFYNENKDTDPDQKSHFFVTQFQTLLLAIFITGLMQLSNHLAIYLVYCFPVYFIIVAMQYYIIWKPKEDLTTQFNECNCTLLVICLPIFFGVFYGVFHPTASLDFQKAEDCQLIGSLSNSIQGYEQYSILYINFQYEGQQYLGAACSSNQSKGSTVEKISPYKFYYKYDSVNCGRDDGDEIDNSNSRTLQQITSSNMTSNRFLAAGGGGSSGGFGGDGGSSSGGDYSDFSSDGTTCSRDYKWSKAKIASWLCLERGFDLEEYIEKKACYVNFFSGQKATLNGLGRSPMKDQYNFPLISYSQHAYYPKADLVCLIIFTYYLWILSFNSIFQYTSNYILRKVRIFKLKSLFTAQQQSQQNQQQQQQQKPQDQQSKQSASTQNDSPTSCSNQVNNNTQQQSQQNSDSNKQQSEKQSNLTNFNIAVYA